MKRLSRNWITEPRLDFEYKKYSLLAYLQEVEQAFSSFKIFPYLNDLRACKDSIYALVKAKAETQSSFRSDLKRIDLENKKFIYEHGAEESAGLKELDQIARYSLDKIGEALEEGVSLEDDVRSEIELFPIGLRSSWEDEGFLLVQRNSHIFTFRYMLHKISPSNQNSTIDLRWVRRFKTTSTDRFEELKINLVREENTLAPKAAFGVIGAENIPLKEAVLPISLRELESIIMTKKEG